VWRLRWWCHRQGSGGRFWPLGVLLVACATLAPHVYAQDISTLPGQWVTFNRSHGLPGDDVHAAWGVPGGSTIWAGTTGGLARFNGVAWQTVQGDAPALHGTVEAIWGHSAQDLWVAGDAGLAHFDGQGWRQVPSTEIGLSEGRLYALWGSDVGDLWVGGEQGTAHYNGTSWRAFTPETLPFEYADVRAITGSKDGSVVWIGTISGLARYDSTADTWIKQQIADLDLTQASPFRQNRISAYGLGGPWVNALLLTTEALWIGTSDGLLQYDLQTGQWKLIDGSQWDGPDGVTGIGWSEGDLWLTVSAPDFTADFESVQVEKTRSDGGVRRFAANTWRQYGQADGLGSKQVRAMWSDGRGVFWFATHNGLSRFDAERWRFYTPDVPVAQPMAMVRGDKGGNIWFVGQDAVYLWQDGRWAPTIPAESARLGIMCLWTEGWDDVWAGTWSNGVSHWDGQRWTTFNTPAGLSCVKAVWSDGPGSVWLGTNEGLSHLDVQNAAWETLTTSNSPLPSDLVTALWGDKGEVWAGFYDGSVVHYAPVANRMEIYPKVGLENRTGPLDLVGNNVRSLAVDKAGNLWVATSVGVARYNRDDGTWQQWRGIDILPPGDEPHEIAVASDGTAWLSSEREGVYKYSPKDDGWERFAPDRLISGDLSVWIDSGDRPWFGGGGAQRLDPKTGEWLTLSAQDGLASDDVRAIWGDAGGTLWFATRLGVSRLSEGRWQIFTADSGLGDSNTTLLTGDQAGNVWVSNLSGVNHYVNGAWQATFPWPGTGMLGRDLYAPGGGRLWVASPEGALYYYDGSVWTEVPVTGEEEIGPVQAVVEDSQGNLWVGGEKGLAHRPAGQANWTTITTDKPADFRINAIWGDGRSFVWVGTADGISRYNIVGGSWQHFRTSEGLLSNTVSDLWGDENVHLWAAHDGGVSAFDGTSWRALPADGLPSPKVNSVWGDASGRLWAGTDAGPAQWNGTQWQPMDAGQSRFSGKVLDMWQADDGLWIGTTNEVLRVNGDDWQTWTPSNPNPIDGYTAVWSDGHGMALAGGRILARFDGVRWHAIPWQEVLGDAYQENYTAVRDIWGTSANDIYVTTNWAVAHFDGTRWNLFNDKDAVKVIGDGLGGLWMLGWGMSYHIAGGQSQSIVSADLGSVLGIWRMPDNSLWLSTDEASYELAAPGAAVRPAGGAVRALASDASGTLWFADASYTLHRWDGRSPDRSLAPALLNINGRDIAVADNIIQEDRNGDIWFRTSDGLGRYRPRRPEVTLESISMADGRTAARSGQEITLPYQPARATLTLIATDTTSLPEDMTYWYRLEGWDSDWKSNQGAAGIDKRIQIQYVGLKEGRYTLQVAVNNANLDSTGVQSWPLTVEPVPWYVIFRESPAFWWVLGVVGLLLLGAGGGVLRILQSQRAYGYRDTELVVQAKGADKYQVIWQEPRKRPVAYPTQLKRSLVDPYLVQLEANQISGSELRQLGQLLFDTLYNDVIRHELLLSMRAGRKGRRLRLNLSETPQLLALPWEFSHGAAGLEFLGVNPNTTVVRYLPPSEELGRLKTKWPLEVLVIWAEPRDLPPVEAEKELATMRTAVEELEKAGRLRLRPVPHATFEAFSQAVSEGADVIHFIGHGGLEAGQSVLYFEDEYGDNIPQKADELAATFRGFQGFGDKAPKLVVLSACRSGVLAPGSGTLSGLAPALLQQGRVPAVVGMQYPLGAEVAARFAGHFYHALVSHGGGQVDYAASVARKALYTEIGADRRDWGAPVVFMQVEDGHVFEVL
jgi:ligand-binding sensor domain-containing protein